MKEYNIACIAGDGIGTEVVPEGLKILKEAALKHQFKVNFTELLSKIYFKLMFECLSLIHI